jgi:RNA polymerase sigma factor (sigma-70 family)
VSFHTNQAADDLLQVQKCLGGDLSALGALRERLDGPLRAILRSRGASPTEADDTVADLWGECVADGAGRPVLLDKYSGKCPLQSWLATVATNRWYDLKRHEARGFRIFQGGSDPSEHTTEPPPQPAPAPGEDAIVDLLRGSLKAAFAAISAESMVLLRLVYLHGLSQREVARMLGWNETKLSRVLKQAMQQIEDDTLREVEKRDSWLALTWQDFLDLCQTEQIGFL